MLAQMKSMAMIRKQPIPRWRQRAVIPMSSKRRTLKGKSAPAKPAWPALFRSRPRSRKSEDSFSGYLAVIAIRRRRFHHQRQRRRADRAVFDYADFTGTK